ncbi:MAG TPA: hypothetical protein VJL58_02410 [Pyrinomonadaceae bacterium]|nr:hypothetical protein [Pyrinomonadaceae bacterium]
MTNQWVTDLPSTKIVDERNKLLHEIRPDFRRPLDDRGRTSVERLLSEELKTGTGDQREDQRLIFLLISIFSYYIIPAHKSGYALAIDNFPQLARRSMMIQL